MGTNVNEGLGDRNSIRISLGKSVRWVNDELGWEIGRVVLVDGKHLVDGYFGGMRTHYLVQGYHGGLFFVKDSILEDAPARDTYEDKNGNPLPSFDPSVKGIVDPHTPPSNKAEEYSKEHKRTRQACNSVEQAATLDCRKGKSIQFD